MTSAPEPAGQQTVRRHNLSLITRSLLVQAGSRSELAQRTGLTKATVSSLVDSLLAQAIVVEEPAPMARVGRPARPVALNPDGPLALGVEINVDYLAACLLNLPGESRGHLRVMVDNRTRSPAQILEQLARLAAELLAERSLPLVGVGLAAPGVVAADGQLLRVPNLPLLAGRFLGREFGELMSLPDPVIDNEANFGALAFLRSSPIDRNLVYVSGEIGVGAGLIVDGSLFRGMGGFAGELGHVVVDRDGPSCSCGGRGCLEQYAGQEVLLRSAGQTDPASLEAAAAASDPAALVALAEAGSALGVGLASLLNVLDVPTVVLGGLYARLFELLTPALRHELDRRVLSGSGTRLRRSTLGTEAAVLGAAGAVLDRALNDPAGLLEEGGILLLPNFW